MANQALVPRPQYKDELNLLLPKEKFDTPLWRSLLGNVRDKLFPEKLPPLQLTSRPVKVRDIWGEYNYKKKGAVGSLVVHGLMIAALITVSILGARVVKQVVKAEDTVSLVAPDISDYLPISNKKNDVIGGQAHSATHWP